MNKRIKKKKEKQSIMEHSFQLVPVYPMKRRRKIVNRIWQMYTKEGLKISIGYKERKKNSNGNKR